MREITGYLRFEAADVSAVHFATSVVAASAVHGTFDGCPFFHPWLGSHDNANLARWRTWCDADASSFWKIRQRLTLNKKYISHDFNWQSF